MARTNCWFCGAEMIWQSDFSFEDYGIWEPEDGIIAEMSCSNCETTASFYHTITALEELKKDMAIEVINYLNKAVGTRYKPTTAKTKKCIKARVKEGYTLKDFETVIDKKVKEWLDTEMEKYLRPDTLFGSNFEIYLNQKGCDKNGTNTIRSTKQNIIKDKDKFGEIKFNAKV